MTITSMALTGLAPTNVDPWGRMYVTEIDEGAGQYHIDLFLDEARSTAGKVGYTATYTTTGSKAVIAYNTSGLGGTLSVGSLNANANTRAHFYRYGVVDAITASLLTVDGPHVNEGTIPYMWHGNPERVIPFRYFLPGPYALADATDGLDSVAKTTDFWEFRRAHLARLWAYAETVSSGTKPYVNMNFGPSYNYISDTWVGLTAAKTKYMAVDLRPDNCLIDSEERIQIYVDQTDASSDDKNLTVGGVMVIE